VQKSEKTASNVGQHQKEIVFFPGINGLRFFAALAVIITHIELLKSAFGFKNIWTHPIIYNLGGLGVYFFFVLSGFLITFLLLKEKEKIGRVKIREFYIRRILRIWPLYYLILILGFFVLPLVPGMNINYLQKSFETHFTGNLVLYAIILPNVAFAFFSPVPHIGHLWSIGVEEQFYIGWPFIVGKSKNILKALIIIILLLFVLKALVLLLGKFYNASKLFQAIKMIVAMSKFECMAIGGIGAYFLFKDTESILKFVHHRLTFNLALISIPLLIYFTPDYLQDAVHIVFSLVFLIIILNVISGRKMIFNLETKLLSYLGKISYGLYMYHFMVVAFVMYLAKKNTIQLSEPIFNILIYSSVVLLSVLISSLSYELFEKKFIKLKAKFSTVQSTANQTSNNEVT